MHNVPAAVCVGLHSSPAVLGTPREQAAPAPPLQIRHHVAATLQVSLSLSLKQGFQAPWSRSLSCSEKLPTAVSHFVFSDSDVEGRFTMEERQDPHSFRRIVRCVA